MDRDETDTSKAIVDAVGNLTRNGQRYTVLHMVDVLKGCEHKKIVDSGNWIG